MGYVRFFWGYRSTGFGELGMYSFSTSCTDGLRICLLRAAADTLQVATRKQTKKKKAAIFLHSGLSLVVWLGPTSHSSNTWTLNNPTSQRETQPATAVTQRISQMCGEKTEVTQDPTDLGWYCEEQLGFWWLFVFFLDVWLRDRSGPNYSDFTQVFHPKGSWGREIPLL